MEINCKVYTISKYEISNRMFYIPESKKIFLDIINKKQEWRQ